MRKDSAFGFFMVRYLLNEDIRNMSDIKRKTYENSN